MVGSSARNWTTCLTQRACPTWLDSCVGQLKYGPHKQHAPHSWTAVLDSSTVAHRNIMSHKIKHYVPHKQHVPHSMSQTNMSHRTGHYVPHNETVCPIQLHSPHKTACPIQTHIPYNQQYVQYNQTACLIQSNSMSHKTKHVPYDQTHSPYKCAAHSKTHAPHKQHVAHSTVCPTQSNSMILYQ